VLYLGKDIAPAAVSSGDGMITLNQCLSSSVSRFTPGTLLIPPRIGFINPLLTYRDRTFLRQFAVPVRYAALSGDAAELVAVYKRLLFLIEYI
jgi:hypothetical protein